MSQRLLKTTSRRVKLEPQQEQQQDARATRNYSKAANENLQMEDDIVPDLPQRGRPSKKLMLVRQNAQRIYAAKPPESTTTTTTTKTSTKTATGTTATTIKVEPGTSAAAKSAANRIENVVVKVPKKYNTNKKKAALDSQRQHPSESFVMKLFDRSLDLSHYTATTPLYPICRAWMANQPRNPAISKYAKREDLKSLVKRENNGAELLEKLRRREIVDIKALPLPRKTELKPIPDVLEQDDVDESRKLEGASQEALLAANKQRWRRIKTHWYQHSKKYNQERYETTYRIIDMLYRGN